MNRELEFDFSAPPAPEPPKPEVAKATAKPRKPTSSAKAPPAEAEPLEPQPQQEPERDVYTPGRLNREARVLLERGLPALWLEGEISNLSRPSSGHWYFSLKDESAQLRCAMFRQRNLMTRFTPRDGSHVLVQIGRASCRERA